MRSSEIAGALNCDLKVEFLLKKISDVEVKEPVATSQCDERNNDIYLCFRVSWSESGEDVSKAFQTWFGIRC